MVNFTTEDGMKIIILLGSLLPKEGLSSSLFGGGPLEVLHPDEEVDVSDEREGSSLLKNSEERNI